MREFLFDHEKVLIVDLLSVIWDFTPSSKKDKWKRHHFKDESYYVATTYSCFLISELLSDRQIIYLEVVMPTIWSW